MQIFGQFFLHNHQKYFNVEQIHYMDYLPLVKVFIIKKLVSLLILKLKLVLMYSSLIFEIITKYSFE